MESSSPLTPPSRGHLPLLLLLLIFAGQVWGVGIAPDLPYPQGTPDAAAIARLVYFVNHFYGVRNIRFGDRRHPMVLVNQAAGSAPKVMTLERRLNNDYHDGVTRARDLAIFRSGKLRGTGILVQDYVDPGRSLSFSIWLPALRKVRRYMEPNQADAWGGSDFTYGDIYLRRPDDETHEILDQTSFPDCLRVLEIPQEQRNRYTRVLPKASCEARGRPVYRLRSRPRAHDWWYDQRIVWVDRETFADYRSEYYKDGKRIKILDKDWRSMGLPDPRAQYWLYWYAIDLRTGHQGMAFVPEGGVGWNEKVKPRLWSEATLRKIKR